MDALSKQRCKFLRVSCNKMYRILQEDFQRFIMPEIEIMDAKEDLANVDGCWDEIVAGPSLILEKARRYFNGSQQHYKMIATQSELFAKRQPTILLKCLLAKSSAIRSLPHNRRRQH